MNGRKKLHRLTVFDYINYAFLLLCVVVMIYPFVFVLGGSFSDGQDYMNGGVWLLPRVWTFANYQVIVSDNRLSKYNDSDTFWFLTLSVVYFLSRLRDEPKRIKISRIFSNFQSHHDVFRGRTHSLFRIN